MHADELRFKQVVLNLVSNAVKFTPDGGRVDVRAERDDTEFVITVTDTGMGIPPEDRERIFESFQQGGRGVAPRGGHRARAHAVASHRGGPLRGPAVVGVGGRGGQHLRLLAPAGTVAVGGR